MDFNQESNKYPGYLDPNFPFQIKDIVYTQGKLSFHINHVIQIVYLKKGKLYYPTNTSQVSIKSSTLIIIPSKYKKDITCSTGAEILRIVIGESLWQEISHIATQQKVKNSSDELVIFPLDRDTNFEIYSITFDIKKESFIKSSGYRYIIRSKIIELFLKLNRMEISMQKPSEEHDSYYDIGSIIKFIQDNYTENFSLNDLALKCNMNPAYFSRIFKQRIGTPLFQYINQIRIQKACVLLKKSNRSIIDIAYEVGYQNLSFFNRYFKKIMMMSPRKYRNSIQK